MHVINGMQDAFMNCIYLFHTENQVATQPGHLRMSKYGMNFGCTAKSFICSTAQPSAQLCRAEHITYQNKRTNTSHWKVNMQYHVRHSNILAIQPSSNKHTLRAQRNIYIDGASLTSVGLEHSWRIS